jgi:hypothetical protein
VVSINSRVLLTSLRCSTSIRSAPRHSSGRMNYNGRMGILFLGAAIVPAKWDPAVSPVPTSAEIGVLASLSKFTARYLLPSRP